MYYDPFEHLAAKFISEAALKVPEQLISLVMASPLSARSSDLCMLWHPNYREKHKIKLLVELLFSSEAAFLKGLVRLAGRYKPFGYAIYGQIKDTLLVLTSACAFKTAGHEYKTPYIPTEKEDAIFIFGSYNDCGINARQTDDLSLKSKIVFLWALMRSGIYAFGKVRGDFYSRTILLLQWISWALSLRWLYDYYLEKALSETVVNHNIRKIGCIHEMHYYSRIVWRIAAKYGVKGYTLQHAAVTEGKRWFFHYPEERQSGLALPYSMYVFNKEMIEMFKPYYGDTNLLLGCSYRYSGLKDAIKHRCNKGSYYLFVSALPVFDNHILIDVLFRLLTSCATIPFRVRFHPDAHIGLKDRLMVRAYAKRGLVAVSRGASLKADIENAIAVIGMGTTVLEEALFLGKPVIQVTHPDYLQYVDVGGVQGAIKKDYREVSPADLLAAANAPGDHPEIRSRLGLDQQVVNYKRLFQDIAAA